MGKISGYPAATTPLAGDELIVMVQGGETVQGPLSDLDQATGTVQSVVPGDGIFVNDEDPAHPEVSLDPSGLVTGGVFSSTDTSATTTVTNTAVETELAHLTLPAGQITSTTKLVIDAVGLMICNSANATYTWRLKINGTTVWTYARAATTSGNRLAWVMQWLIFCHSDQDQLVGGKATFGGGAGIADAADGVALVGTSPAATGYGHGTVDMSVASTITLTVQVSVAGASNNVSLFGLAGEIVLPPAIAAGDVTVPPPTGGDDTAMILTAINSAGQNRAVNFPTGSSTPYLVQGTLEVQNRRGLTINCHGRIIQATTPGTLNRAHWRFTRCHDLTLNDPHVVGANPFAGTTDPAYDALYESQHAFEIRGGTNYTINNPVASDIYGDFIYLTDSAGWVDGVHINNVAFARNGRQGISVIAARNVVIDGGTLAEIRRTFCDIEPNTISQGAANINIGNLTVTNVRLNFLSSKGADAMVDGVTMHDIHMLGTAWTSALTAEINPPTIRRRNFTIRDCTAVNQYGTARGDSLHIVRVDGLTVTGCTQPMQAGRGMALVGAVNCTAVDVHGNTVANGIELRTT